MISRKKLTTREKRKKSIRKKVYGTLVRPRLTVFRSDLHIYAQVINDDLGITLVSASSLEKEMSKGLVASKKKDKAKKVGLELAKRCLAKGIDKVVFDRNGYLYHGRVLSLAEGAREAGLQF